MENVRATIFYIIKCWCDKWLLVIKKSDISDGFKWEPV